MAGKFMYIPNDDTQNFLYIKISSWNVLTLNLIIQPIKIQSKSPKLLNQPIRKRYEL